MGHRCGVLRLTAGLIQAFRAFQISPEFQERFGYPALTDEIKRKVLGSTLRLHDVDPVSVPCAHARHRRRAAMPMSFPSTGPHRSRALRAHLNEERRHLRI